MIKSKVGFVTYGVHKDGLKDPSGNLFIDADIIARSKAALAAAGVDLVDTNPIVATKQEAKDVILPLAKDDSIDAIVLFSGTWVWAAHMIGPLREFAKTGKGIIVWTYPGSQGWRPVGGLVLKAALKEIGIPHRFVYGAAEDPAELEKIASYCQASALKNRLQMTTLAAFGGRGMGQTCGVADPSQWMKTFGIDIDSRDTTELLETAKAVTTQELDEAFEHIKTKFVEQPARNAMTERSVRLYLALKKLIAKYNFDYYTIQSFPGLADNYTASCFAQSMMLDEGIPTSTLSDFNTALTSIMMTYLSPEPTYYGDLQCLDKAAREVKIIGDGAVPPSLANKYGARFAEHGIATEGTAGGLSVSLVCKAGEGVLGRVSRADGRFRLVVARCSVYEPDDSEIERRRAECGIPFWPHAFLKVDCDVDQLMENWDNEYACLGYGRHLYQQLIDFGQLCGMEVVAL
jgi:L-fucose isomerase-like protein